MPSKVGASIPLLTLVYSNPYLVERLERAVYTLSTGLEGARARLREAYSHTRVNRCWRQQSLGRQNTGQHPALQRRSICHGVRQLWALCCRRRHPGLRLQWVETTRPRTSASEHRTFTVGSPAMSPLRRPSQADPERTLTMPIGRDASGRWSMPRCAPASSPMSRVATLTFMAGARF